MQNDQIKLITIVGPTASGKSDLAVYLAKKFNGEVVSADSRQVYKWMDIGTGKVTEEEMQSVPHHLLDVAHPSRQFTVKQYKEKAEEAIKKIHKKGRLPILVGGTGFYIDTVIYDTEFPEVPPNKELRHKLEKSSTEELFEVLKKKDPKRAQTIQKDNKRRLIRALEIIEATGEPVPDIAVSGTAMSASPYDLLVIGIKVPQEELDIKIKKRLVARLKEGMIDEVKKLREKHNISWKRLENFGLEYRWIAQYLQKKVSREEMEEKLFTDIRKYSKRQMTWFKRDKNIKWLELREKKQLQEEADELVKNFAQGGVSRYPRRR
ncbi:MAG: tRNA (adenosine(37)-N6)-dimethylallyltransferase MiaA, partial [Candidatus Spechtbacterales bacterium]